MNSKSLVLSLGSLIFGCVIGDGACAQNVQPIPVELGTSQPGRLDDSAPRQANKHPFACYALNTQRGEEVSIRVKSSAFDPALAVARGALCTAAALQFENDNVDETSKDAVVSFRAAGGRYLIFVRGTSPDSRGSYQLKLEAGLNKPPQEKTAASDDAELRRQIMAMEIEKRNAELAAAEAKRRAEQAQAEAQRAAWLAQEREREQYEQYEDDYEDDYDDSPAPNVMAVFVNTLASELAAHQQAQQEFQRGLDQAVRRGEAEYQRRVAAEQAGQRQQQAAHQAAAQQAQAAEAQRRAAESARAAAEATRRVAIAQEQRLASAQRSSDRWVAKPAGGQTPAASSSSAGGRASTRNNPSSCVTGPTLVKNPNCPNGAGAQVQNQCGHTIDARICHWTTRDRWDCGTTTVRPGGSGGYPSCYGTGRMWMTVQYSDSRTKFADPP